MVEGGGTRFHRVDVAGGSTSQTGASQTVDRTQHKDHHIVIISIIRRKRISLNIIRRDISLSITRGIKCNTLIFSISLLVLLLDVININIINKY